MSKGNNRHRCLFGAAIWCDARRPLGSASPNPGSVDGSFL